MNRLTVSGLLSAGIISILLISFVSTALPTGTEEILRDEDPFYSAFRRMVVVNINLSQAAVEQVNSYITVINEKCTSCKLYPLAIIGIDPFAIVTFQDASMVRNRTGEIIGDGLNLGVNLYLPVYDPSRSGLTLLTLAGFNTNSLLLEYFHEELELTASVATSQVSRMTNIKNKQGVDEVHDKWAATGFQGKIKLNMHYSRESPIYVPAIDSDSHYADNYIGLRYNTNPNTLVEVSRRSTIYNANIEQMELSFKLENSTLSAIFSDEANVVNQVTQEYSEILLEIITFS